MTLTVCFPKKKLYCIRRKIIITTFTRAQRLPRVCVARNIIMTRATIIYTRIIRVYTCVCVCVPLNHLPGDIIETWMGAPAGRPPPPLGPWSSDYDYSPARYAALGQRGLLCCCVYERESVYTVGMRIDQPVKIRLMCAPAIIIIKLGTNHRIMLLVLVVVY